MLELHYTKNGLPIGLMRLTDAPWASHNISPHQVALTHRGDAEYARIADFIADRYAKTYGADIRITYPTLMSVHDAEGTVLAAVGFRVASEEKLFLEPYLHAPLEDVVRSARADIVEMGSLAARNGGATVFLYTALVGYLYHQGYVTGVLTATASLEKRLLTMGFPLVRLAEAKRERVAHLGGDWGDYYRTNPHVVAGDIATAYHHLQHAMELSYTALAGEETYPC